MSNKPRSSFWPIQLTAWIIVGLLNFYNQHTIHPIPVFFQYLNLIGISAGGLLVTTGYRFYLKKYNYKFRLKVGQFILFLLGSILIQSICWLLLIILMAWPFAGKYHINMVLIVYSMIPLTIMILIWNLIYLTYHLIRQYQTTEIEKWKLEAEVQKAQLGALKSQINPHFMFNALNNIRALILEDPQLARQMLTKFAEIFRYALQHSEDKETTVAEEIDILTQYLELVKIQYEDKLQFTISTSDHVLQENIPPMILQLLVENAVKHGIALSTTGGLIAVDIKRTDKQLLLTVSNTGNLQQKNYLEKSTGIGLKNITERLRLLYDDKAILKIQEESPFVKVTISIEKS